MPRVFIGLELPDPIKRRLLSLHRPLSGARWQSAGQLHLTLCFIGQVGDDWLERLPPLMKDLPGAGFDLQVRGLHCFGNPQRARNLWVGVAPEVPLVELHEEVSRRLVTLGWSPEKRRFRPHITIARFGRRPGRVASLLDDHRQLRLPEFPVTAITLFKSTQTPKGSRYDVIGCFPLSGGLPAPESS